MDSSPLMYTVAALITIYSVVSAALAAFNLFVFWMVRRDSAKDPRSQQAMEAMESMADLKNTTIWGVAVMAALKWPLVMANNMRRGR